MNSRHSASVATTRSSGNMHPDTTNTGDHPRETGSNSATQRVSVVITSHELLKGIGGRQNQFAARIDGRRTAIEQTFQQLTTTAGADSLLEDRGSHTVKRMAHLDRQTL